MSAQQQEVSVITRQELADQRAEQRRLIPRFAERYGVDADKLLVTLKATAFKQRNGVEITNEQMMALLVVADQYHLNPFTKEIYAYPDKNNGIVPVVGVDGWARIINEHPSFDGMDFRRSETTAKPDMGKDCPEWIECVMHRKDRSHATEVREYLDEVYRPPFFKNGEAINGPWQTHTKRMLRHKAVIQCGRLAFGFVGIYDPDEAERIIEAEPIDVTPGNETIPAGKKVGAKKLREVVTGIRKACGNLVDDDADEPDAVKLHAIYGQLDSEQQLFVWEHLESWERAAVKKLKDSPAYKIAESGLDVASWSIEALRRQANAVDLEKTYAIVQEIYAEHDQEVPLDIQTVHSDRKTELGA